MNLLIDKDTLATAIRDAFAATEVVVDWPEQRATELLKSRYRDPDWHFRLK